MGLLVFILNLNSTKLVFIDMHVEAVKIVFKHMFVVCFQIDLFFMMNCYSNTSYPDDYSYYYLFNYCSNPGVDSPKKQWLNFGRVFLPLKELPPSRVVLGSVY